MNEEKGESGASRRTGAGHPFGRTGHWRERGRRTKQESTFTTTGKTKNKERQKNVGKLWRWIEREREEANKQDSWGAVN